MIGVFARSDDKKHQAEGTTLPTNTRRPHRYDLSQKPSVAPTHIAVIMDGNRRYGNRVHRDALKGHWDGGKTLTDFIQVLTTSRLMQLITTVRSNIYREVVHERRREDPHSVRVLVRELEA
jgi:undecaprenyl pyrophosphate synthase